MQLPHESNIPFLSDGGFETDIIFNQGENLPEFSAIDLLKDERGENIIREYFQPYLETARQKQVGFIMESATWRASPDWAPKIGYSQEQMNQLIEKSIHVLKRLKQAHESKTMPIAISGCMGPRGDGYNPSHLMTIEEATAYHLPVATTLVAAGVDMITGMTINYEAEAIGIANAAAKLGIPCVMSLTVETDGALVVGTPLLEAIRTIDEQATVAPAYYMVNCAHPEHFEHIFDTDDSTLLRIKGIRANASCLSHAELDECEVLDDGDPDALAKSYVGLQSRLPDLRVFGGCCGTDHRHVQAIADQCLSGS